MADWALIEGQDAEAIGTVSAGSDGTTITASASTNTKGSYTQLIASTAFDITWLCVQIQPFDTLSAEFLVDIALGAPTEQVILSNLYAESPSAAGRAPVGNYAFPLSIPAGTEISARCQSSVISGALDISVCSVGASFIPSQPLSIVDTYGDDTSDSGGTQVDPGTTANTKGSWAEIVASTTREIRNLIFMTGRSATNLALTDADFLLDIGVGASGSEQEVLKNYYFFTASSGDVFKNFNSPCFPIHIPAGSRLSVRAQSTEIGTDRLFDFIAYGAN